MEKEYTAALLRDIELFAPLLGEVRTVYFGGGTPSLFSLGSIREVLQAISDAAGSAPDAEISLELNPGTGTEEKIRGFRDAGITRLSIGVQSFSDMELRRLGRIHTSEEAEETVRSALGAGFRSVNADLMQGLPGQTAELASADVRKAVSLGVQHISWYQLTIEEGTPMAEDPPELPDEDTLDRINAEGAGILSDAGSAIMRSQALRGPAMNAGTTSTTGTSATTSAWAPEATAKSPTAGAAASSDGACRRIRLNT